MKPEQMPSNNNQDNLSKKALELEKINRMTENATDMEMKETMILKMDKLNEVLVNLEEQSGLSQEEIMENYKQLSEKLANERINDLIKEFSPEVQNEIWEDIKKGGTKIFLEAIKDLAPQKITAAASLALMVVVSTEMIVPVEAEAQYEMTVDNIDQDIFSKRIAKLSKQELSSEFIRVSEAVAILDEVDKLIIEFEKDGSSSKIMTKFNNQMIRLRNLVLSSNVLYNIGVQNRDFLATGSRTRLAIKYVNGKLLEKTVIFKSLTK